MQRMEVKTLIVYYTVVSITGNHNILVLCRLAKVRQLNNKPANIIVKNLHRIQRFLRMNFSRNRFIWLVQQFTYNNS